LQFPSSLHLLFPPKTEHLIRIVKFNVASGYNFPINHYNLAEHFPPDSASEIIALFSRRFPGFHVNWFACGPPSSAK